MKKRNRASLVVILYCLSFYSSQTLGSDIDKAQLAALGEKKTDDGVIKNRESLEGRVVAPGGVSLEEHDELGKWEKAYKEQQQRLKNYYEN